MRRWKWIGLAGLAGVATTATVIAVRKRRSWTEHEPAELRALLHERLATSVSAPPGDSEAGATSIQNGYDIP